MSGAGEPMVRLRLSCGCTINVEFDNTVPGWEPGEATFCDDDAHGLVDVVAVTEPWPEMDEVIEEARRVQ